MAKQGDNTAKQGVPPDATKWKPGQSGNPNGRPKSRPIAAAIKALAENNDGEALKALAAVGLKRALKGDFRFYKEIMERIDGKVLTELDMTSAGEQLPSAATECGKAIAAALHKVGKDAMDGQ